MFIPKLNSILLPTVDRHTQYLSITSLSSIKCLVFCFCEGHFADPPNSWLKQWHQWRVPIEQWGPGFALTDYGAHYCVIGHCVGVMVAHGMSQTVVFATSLTPPTLPHPIPTCRSSHPPPLFSILTVEKDSKNTIKFSY